MIKANRTRTLWLSFGLVFSAGVSPAAAHSLHLFAEGDGTVIRGKAYFRGGSPARDAQVTAFDPDGRKLFETRTDNEGAFAVEAPYRCDYQLRVATADGHGAEFRLAAEELSSELPPPGPADDPATPKERPEAMPLDSVSAKPPHHAVHDTLTDEFRAMRAQLSALRQEMAEYQQRTRFRDVVGGIGYILGLAGIAFYTAARRAGKP